MSSIPANGGVLSLCACHGVTAMFVASLWDFHVAGMEKMKAKKTSLGTKRDLDGVGFVGICGETPHTANGPARALVVINMAMRVYEAKEACVVSKRGPPRRRARSLCSKHPQLPGRRAREARCLEYGEAKEACVVSKRDLRGHQQGERETRAREAMSHPI